MTSQERYKSKHAIFADQRTHPASKSHIFELLDDPDTELSTYGRGACVYEIPEQAGCPPPAAAHHIYVEVVFAQRRDGSRIMFLTDAAQRVVAAGQPAGAGAAQQLYGAVQWLSDSQRT